MNSKRVLCTVLVALSVFFGVFFVADSFARYSYTGSPGAMSVNVARWAVALKKSDDTPLSQSFQLKFTSENNSAHVAPNKFAPSTEMKASLALDLTGTEVAVDYNITAATSVFGNKFQSGDIALAVYDNDTPTVLGKEVCIPLSDITTKHTFKFVLSWKANGDSATDTAFAINRSAVSLPVTIRVRQHIYADDVDESRKVMSGISYSETEASKDRTTGANILAEQDILNENPEKGFYSTSFLKLTESGKDASRAATAFKSDTSSMLYLKVDLSAFSGNMNASKTDKELTDAAITALDNTLRDIKQNNNTVILRFVYDNSATGIIADKSKVEPDQTMLLRHIGQLGNTFKKYSTTINVIQVGFYGLWGECYYNTDAVENGATYYPQTVNALLDATSGTEITIAVRAVQYYNWYKAGVAHADDARVGIFNDAYGANETDMGTYLNRKNDTDRLSERFAETYYGGEAIADSGYVAPDPEHGIIGSPPEAAVGDYNHPDSFIPEAYKLHTSYLNWEWNQAIHTQWAALPYTGDYSAYNNTALAYIESHLGYRFVVKEVKTYGTVTSADRTLPIDITVLNTGFANLIKSKKCDVVITDSNGDVVHTVKNVAIDGKKFVSRASVKQSINISLPTLKQGRYNVYLRMSSGETLTDGKYYSAVRFANDDIWSDKLQANYIAGFEVIAE